jgi:TPR repeat protein
MTRSIDTKKRSLSEIKADALFVKASAQWDRGKLRSAFLLFLESAKLGDSGAQHNVAYFYDVGVGMKQNRAKALYWYKRAFRRGLGGAAGNIGTIFRDEMNSKQAMLWFARAVSLGDADCNLNIAKMYLAENEKDRRAVIYLHRTVKAKPSQVTEASKEEAALLLNRFRAKSLPARNRGLKIRRD